jgi:hypothetical protein
MNLSNIASIGAFIYSGLAESGATDPTVNRDSCSGLIGLVADASIHAEYIEMKYQAGIKKHGDCPGVFDYDVSSPFGNWFGEYFLQFGDTPDVVLCQKEIDSLARLCFEETEGAAA